MMRKDEFIWKGESSLTYGIYLISPFNVPSFVKRVEELVIQGKNGTQFIEEGSYASDICSANIVFKMESTTKEFHEIFEWLSGKGTLIIPQRPNVTYNASIYNLISAQQFIINQVYDIPLSFNVNPFAMLGEGLNFVDIPNVSIINKGKLEAFPIFKINTSCTIRIGDVECNIKVEESGQAYISTETREAIDIVNNSYCEMTGNFPTIPVGKSVSISCTDPTAQIMYRWCEL